MEKYIILDEHVGIATSKVFFRIVKHTHTKKSHQVILQQLE